MPIAPKPSKFVCTKCGYTKTLRPKSDTDILGMIPPGVCPKCNGSMERKPLSPFDKIIDTITQPIR